MRMEIYTTMENVFLSKRGCLKNVYKNTVLKSTGENDNPNTEFLPQLYVERVLRAGEPDKSEKLSVIGT